MSDSGRYYVRDTKSNRLFCVEPIEGGEKSNWGDVNPSTGKLEGSYGSKYKGAIKEKDSIITEENSFKNIQMLKPGESPDSVIKKLLEK